MPETETAKVVQHTELDMNNKFKNTEKCLK